jgi:SAM-dependent methyltransferase
VQRNAPSAPQKGNNLDDEQAKRLGAPGAFPQYEIKEAAPKTRSLPVSVRTEKSNSTLLVLNGITLPLLKPLPESNQSDMLLNGDMTMEYRKLIYDNYVSVWQDAAPAFDEAAARRWGRPQARLLKRVLPERKDASILDVGCGGGKLIHLFKSMGYADVSGVDLSPEQVALARQVCDRVSLGDAVQYLEAHKGEFDLITGMDVIEHFKKDEVIVFLMAIRGALRENGRVVLQTPNSAACAGAGMQFCDLTHEVGFTPGCLGNVLRICGFSSYQAWETGPAPHGLVSTTRFCLWQIIRAAWLLYDFIEVGGNAFPVYTRVFLASAVKK